MNAKCTKRFAFNCDDQTRIFRPGDIVDDEGAAAWAVEHKHGQELRESGAGKAAKPASNKAAKPASNK